MSKNSVGKGRGGGNDDSAVPEWYREQSEKYSPDQLARGFFWRDLPPLKNTKNMTKADADRLLAEHKKRDLIVRHMADVEIRAIEWEWIGWIPRGYVTLFAGETGASKSTVLADVAARITKGNPWPGETETRQPGYVIWLGSEDAAEDVLVPRLMASGAVLDRIVEIRGVTTRGSRETFSLQDDIAAVQDWLESARAKGTPYSMLVIDPITSYLPGQRLKKVDLNDAGQLRSILEPWLVIAQAFNIAIVGVTHFAKDTTRSMLHRVLGSAAFAQTCRSLVAIVSREDEGMYAKSMIQVKVNLPEHPGGAWLFETEKVQVGADNRSGKPVFATRPVWDRLDAAVTPQSVIGGTRGPLPEYVGPAFSVWVKAQFSDPEQWRSTTELKDAAAASQICSARWWDDHSSEYLDKRNVGGVWVCRPRTV